MKAPLVVLTLCLLLSGCDTAQQPDNNFALTAGGAYSASVSEDGRYAMIGSFELGGHLWDLVNRERLYDWNHVEDGFSDLVASAFSPDGSYAATATTTDLVLWQLSDGQPVWFWSSPGEILDMALSVNGDFALLGLANHTAVYFDIKNGGVRRTLRHPARVRSVALSQDGRYALTGADDYIARFWDLENETLLTQHEFDNVVNRVALSPDSQLAFSAATLNSARLWRTDSGEQVHSLSGDESFFTRRLSHLSARFSTDGSQLVTGTASGRVMLWDVGNGKHLRSWRVAQRGHMGPVQTGVYAVGFSSHSEGLVAVGSNGLLNELR
ncbi:hypothetical protein LH51_18215 [Nitrincola sp. A-D6]|uniref:WD40 repeat domain-containing protein n=1 Tax=Nitrincola sp. A-D6 TaxID=1545442 RepID=UPI00051F9C9A|nr:hypothetical protein [Nitrincola sp. A-D6]KGK41017.1 hypothetical protein LH51_18215 [Nitrincola sp. A-D6]